jgi:hypothetical protein
MAKVPDWAKGDIEPIKESCRLGETLLVAQVQLATAADQRASVLAGIYVAAATGIIGAVATGDAFKTNHALTSGAMVTTAAFLIAAVLCVTATLPRDFWTPGNLPSEWYDDIASGKDFKVSIGEQAAHYDEHIDANNKLMARNARFFSGGALLGIAAPILGAIFYWLTSHWA